MIKKQKKFRTSSEIIKFVMFSAFFLSIPIFNLNKEANAGLEFQWDNNPSYKKLKWFQKDNKRRARNTIFFFLRPVDRKTGLININMKIPKNFKSIIKEEKISLCKVRIGGFESRTKCLNDYPADIEINKDKSSLDIYPYSPIPSDKDSYAIVFKVFNPQKSGLFQFHSFGQASGNIPVSSYLGSWTIVID